MAEKTEFDRLAREWEDATGHHSNLSIIMRHPACRGIAAMGTEAVPWCLQRLKRHRSLSWSMLLREITGADPAPKPERVGGGGFVAFDVEATAKAWLAWGKEQGHLS